VSIDPLWTDRGLWTSDEDRPLILFAVLTCVPDDDGQRALVAETARLPAPGGLVYVSDVVLQSGERNRGRYDARGVFTADDGAVFRHHTVEHLRARFDDFEAERAEPIQVTSMNGHPTAALQLLARRRQVTRWPRRDPVRRPAPAPGDGPTAAPGEQPAPGDARQPPERPPPRTLAAGCRATELPAARRARP
jgi:hypothetical protein